MIKPPVAGRRDTTTKLESVTTVTPQGPLPYRQAGAHDERTQRAERAASGERPRAPEPTGKRRLACEHSAFVPPAGSRAPHTVLSFRSLVFKNIFPHPKPNKNPPQVPDKVPATHTTTFLVPGLLPWGPREAAGRGAAASRESRPWEDPRASGSKPAPDGAHQEDAFLFKVYLKKAIPPPPK